MLLWSKPDGRFRPCELDWLIMLSTGIGRFETESLAILELLNVKQDFQFVDQPGLGKDHRSRLTSMLKWCNSTGPQNPRSGNNAQLFPGH
jgi:hypothetical protein